MHPLSHLPSPSTENMETCPQVLKQVVNPSCFLSYMKYCLKQNKSWNVPTWSAFWNIVSNKIRAENVPTWSAFWILGTSASGSNWEFSSLKMFMVRTLSSDCGRSGSTLSKFLKPWFKRLDDFLAWASPWWEKIYNDKQTFLNYNYNMKLFVCCKNASFYCQHGVSLDGIT